MNKRVALIIETSNEYARGLLHGIRTYIREHGAWAIDFDEHARGEPPKWLAKWDGDGIIARIENRATARAVMKCRVPVVDVSAARLVPGVPWVETDDATIARLAFEHLTERGLKHLAFCGNPAFNWSNWRQEAFVRHAKEAGIACHVFTSSLNPEPRTLNPLSSWLLSLPKPVGVMAAFDIRGREVLEACRQCDLRVPDDVAVIGVDNDELLCDLADPPLSSVAPDTDRTGYIAAQLLDRMMSGRKIPPAAHLVQPIGVVPRLSTDMLAIADPVIAEAVRKIRSQACRGLRVKELLGEIPLSRRIFESRFQAVVGRTPHEEIVRVQMDRVKQLLTQSDLSLSDIAERCGFRHVEYMSVAFKKHTGLPPSGYRPMSRRSM